MPDNESYSKDQQILENLLPDEPIFVLRAKDRFSLHALERYSSTCSEKGCDPQFLEGIRRRINEFSDWQVKHSDQVKRPD